MGPAQPDHPALAPPTDRAGQVQLSFQEILSGKNEVIHRVLFHQAIDSSFEGRGGQRHAVQMIGLPGGDPGSQSEEVLLQGGEELSHGGQLGAGSQVCPCETQVSRELIQGTAGLQDWMVLGQGLSAKGGGATLVT